MKKSIAVFALLLPIVAYSQIISVPVLCVKLKEFAEAIKQYEEIPFIIGDTENNKKDKGHLILFVNHEKRTWTLVEKPSPDLYCVLSAGENLSVIPYKGKGI